MIKVIEHGNTHRRKRCEDCGCVFEFDKVDVILCLDNEIKRLRCPECGKMIVVEKEGEK